MTKEQKCTMQQINGKKKWNEIRCLPAGALSFNACFCLFQLLFAAYNEANNNKMKHV